MIHTAELPNKSPHGKSPSEKQALRKRLLEMIVKREAERRLPSQRAR